MKSVLTIFIGVILILLCIVFLRTALITNQQITVKPVEPARIDINRAAMHLAESIRFKTISHQNPSKNDSSEFLKLHQYLEQAFPLVHSTLSKEVINDHSLLYTWRGTSDELNPIILIAHMDVVPSKSNDWTYPAFSGHIADGYIWGRGSMDVKLSITATLEAIETLIKLDFHPQRTIYLAFGHDEEVGGGNGASKIAALLKKRGIKAAYTLDEGSAIVKGVIPGLSSPVALVALAEKGYLTLELTAKGEGGHSSKPKHLTTIGKLARAIYRLESNLMPAELRQPATGIFEYLASEMSLGTRTLIANLWLFESLLVSRLEKEPATNAIIRTTTAPTMLLESGTKETVLPMKAKAIINFRVLPGDTIKGVMEHVVQIINDNDICVRQVSHSSEASNVTDPKSPEFQVLHKTIKQIFPDVLVAPSLVPGGTDSKHYRQIANNSFRFIPMRLEKEDLKRIHGKDERISIENYGEIIQFYIQLLKNTTVNINN